MSLHHMSAKPEKSWRSILFPAPLLSHKLSKQHQGLLRAWWLGLGRARIKQLHHGSSFKQVELKQSKYLLHASPGAAHELQISQQKIDAHCNPDLSQNSIPGSSQKGLDLEVLLDPFEEQLNLPARLVGGSNGGRGQLEIIGQKNVFPAGFRITIAHTAQRNRAVFSLSAGQPDGLITGQALLRFHLSTLKDTMASIALQPGDKENPLIIQLVIPGVVGIAPVKHNN